MFLRQPGYPELFQDPWLCVPRLPEVYPFGNLFILLLDLIIRHCKKNKYDANHNFYTFFNLFMFHKNREIDIEN